MRCACAHDIRIEAKMFMAEVCGHSRVRVRYRDMRLSRSKVLLAGLRSSDW
jgi:hypothetical protein